MHIFKSKQEISNYIKDLQVRNMSIGFVPTMGALHPGHTSLITRCKSENDICIVSVFVNPTQFNNPEDLIKYPTDTQGDIKILQENGVDALFLPTVEEVYGDNVSSKTFDFGNLDKVMEGEHRKGHFDGVATIVSMLFDLVKANSAYFGEKDYQQYLIIKKLVEIERIATKVIPCPIIREADGLAMSSRNVRLSPNHRSQAPFIYNTLRQAAELSKSESPKNIIKFVEDKFAQNPFFNLEYFEIRDEDGLFQVSDFQSGKKYRAFIAVFADNIRLIDNIQVF